MKRSLTLGVALSLLLVLGMDSVVKAYSPPTLNGSVVVQACKGDKDDDCKS